MAYIEASAFIYQDGKVSIHIAISLKWKTSFLRLESRFFFFLVELLKILIEVDHLQDVPSPYIQIKGANKEAVTAAGSALKLDGSYTTKVPLLFRDNFSSNIVYLLYT